MDFGSANFQSQAWYQGCGVVAATTPQALARAEREGLVAEPKRDGHFAALILGRDRVGVWSRNRKEKCYELPVHRASAGTVLVGEVGEGRQEAVRRRKEIGHNFADVWAVLFLGGRDVRGLADAEQRRLLLDWHAGLPKRLQAAYLPVPRWTTGFCKRYQAEHEGLVLKDPSRPYVGRGAKVAWWSKAKHVFESDVVVMALEWSRARTKQGLPKCVVCGQRAGGRLVPVVRVKCNGGWLQKEMVERFRPGRVMTIQHFGATETGSFNHPSFVGFRDDKDARDCVASTEEA